MDKFLYGAIEAGGTKFNCEIITGSGKVLSRMRIPTTSPEKTLSAVISFFRDQQQDGVFKGFGIAAFGPVDLNSKSERYGHILQTPKPGWSGTDLVTPLGREFGCGVAIDTDVNAAALAEATEGAGKNLDTVVYVTVGTGIGGGIYHAGSTVTGALHPEMGHVQVLRSPLDAEFSGCCPFHSDCLEGLASGTAIRARYGCSMDDMDTQQQTAAIALEAHYLGQLASNIILMLSPQRVIFGGGVMDTPSLLPELRSKAVQILRGYAGTNADDLGRRIVSPGLGERSGICGALLLAKAAASHC